jgi:hypothetical protein
MQLGSVQLNEPEAGLLPRNRRRGLPSNPSFGRNPAAADEGKPQFGGLRWKTMLFPFFVEQRPFPRLKQGRFLSFLFRFPSAATLSSGNVFRIPDFRRFPH